MRRVVTLSLFVAAAISLASLAAPAVVPSGALAAQDEGLVAQNQTLVSPYEEVIITSTSMYAYNPDGISDEVFTWVYLACKLLGGRVQILYKDVNWDINGVITIVRVPISIQCYDY